MVLARDLTMSANNYLLLEKHKQGYKLTERDADSDTVYGKPTLSKSLIKLLELAQTKQVEVEYGIVLKVK